jgi:hypothetical protein
MSIRCVCTNGHVLRVKEALAGSSGLCPLCRTRVEVPKLHSSMSEDAILDILSKEPRPTRTDTAHLKPFGDSQLSGVFNLPGSTKICGRCNREIDSGVHVCPHCHTYVANLRDF